VQLKPRLGSNLFNGSSTRPCRITGLGVVRSGRSDCMSRFWTPTPVIPLASSTAIRAMGAYNRLYCKSGKDESIIRVCCGPPKASQGAVLLCPLPRNSRPVSCFFPRPLLKWMRELQILTDVAFLPKRETMMEFNVRQPPLGTGGSGSLGH
jgi:hypothetical protein